MNPASLPSILGPETAAALAKREFWYRGNLRHLIRPGGQLVAYDFLGGLSESASPCVLNARRALGKTYLLLIMAWERCLRRPNQTVFVVGPTYKQALEISSDGLRFLTVNCPSELRPALTGGNTYTFKNPRWADPSAFSTLRLVGAKEDAASLRGNRANAVFVDELAIFDQPAYVIQDVITPFFAGRDNIYLCIATTPPRTTGHFFSVTMVPDAIAAGRYCEVRASQDPSFTAAEEAKMLSVFKTKESTGWRRELECELIADLSALVIPSFEQNRAVCLANTPAPTHYQAFTAIDMGFIDATAVLFAYIDYQRQVLAIAGEFVRRGVGTRALHNTIRAGEKRYFTPAAAGKVIRIADATKRELDDLRAAGLSCSEARRGDLATDKWRTLAWLDSEFAGGRIIVSPQCTSLVFQLQNAVRNTSSTDIVREKLLDSIDPTAPVMGHADAIFALAYLSFWARPYFNRNPFPAGKHSRDRRQLLAEKNAAGVALSNKPVIIGKVSL